MPLKIFVVGAGIGGPAAALALARNGHSVTIFERATTTTEVGYAFRITPNSDKCLQHLGIDTVAGGAVAATTARLLTGAGDIIAEVGENQNTGGQKAGTSVFAFRPQLAKQLIDAAISANVEVKTGVKVKSVDVQSTSIVFEDGTSTQADLVIGADGLNSVVRPQIVDSTKYRPKSSTGHTAVRFMIPKSRIQSDAGLSTLLNDRYRLVSWKSKTKRILVYPVDFDRQYNLTMTHPDADQEAVTGQDVEENASTAVTAAYDNRVTMEVIRKIYAGFEPRAQRMLEIADPNGFRTWKLLDMEEIPQWSTNRTLLIGDAAHLCLPFGFSGASMAIEDAVMLGELLPTDVKIDEISGRLQLLERLRKPRVGRVRDASRGIAIGWDDDRRVLGEYMQFLKDYDAVEDARRALAELVVQ